MTATYYEQKIKLWTKTQCLTAPHILAVIGFGLLTYGACYNTFILIFGLLAFCLITSFKMIWGMLVVSIIISMLVAAFPPLFPVFIVLQDGQAVCRMGNSIIYISTWEGWKSPIC